MTIGERIRKRRSELGYSIGHVADQAGISQGYLSKIENNVKKPSYNTIEKISKVLHVLPSALINDEPKMEYTDYLPQDLQKFVSNPNNEDWIRLGKELADSGLKPDQVRRIMKDVVEVIKSRP